MEPRERRRGGRLAAALPSPAMTIDPFTTARAEAPELDALTNRLD